MSMLVSAVVGASVVGSIAVIVPTVKIALDYAPFLYANTRCNARSAFLLPKSSYDEFIGSVSTQELFNLIESTSYGPVIGSHREFNEVSGILHQDLFKSYLWLENIVPKKLVPVVAAMREKFTIEEMKNMIALAMSGKITNEIHFIDEKYKQKFEEATDFNSVIAAIESTPYKEIVSGKGQDDAFEIMNEFDRQYYESVTVAMSDVGDADVRAFEEYWKSVIDIINIRLTLRRLKYGVTVKLIVGGNLAVKELDAVNEGTQLHSMLEASMYAQDLHKESDTDIEQSIYGYLRKLASEVSIKYTLRSGNIVRYLIEKELEMQNISTIIKLKIEQIDDETIGHMIV